MPFGFLENIGFADLAFWAKGPSLEELFSNAAYALTSAMVDPKTVRKKKKMEIKLEADNPTELLYDFLSEIVLIKDVDGLLFAEFEVKLTGNKKYCLQASAWGEEINPHTQELRDDVKAVTWHKFGIKRTKEGYSATVVLDV